MSRRAAAFRAAEAAYQERRQSMIDKYAEWHPLEWLERLSLAELICLRNSGFLDRPTLERTTNG